MLKCISLSSYTSSNQIAYITKCVSLSSYTSSNQIAYIAKCISLSSYTSSNQIAYIAKCISLSSYTSSNQIAYIAKCISLSSTMFNCVRKDCQSITGYNLRKIRLHNADLVDDVTKIPYYIMPDHESWRVPIIREISETKSGKNGNTKFYEGRTRINKRIRLL